MFVPNLYLRCDAVVTTGSNSSSALALDEQRAHPECRKCLIALFTQNGLGMEALSQCMWGKTKQVLEDLRV